MNDQQPHSPSGAAAPAEIWPLLSGLCERRLTDDRLRRLEQLVCTDEAAMRAYLEYIYLHGELHRCSGFPPPPPPPDRRDFETDGDAQRPNTEEYEFYESAQAREARGLLGKLLGQRTVVTNFAAALALLLAASGALLLIAHRGSVVPAPTASIAPDQPKQEAVAARLTRQHETHWTEAPRQGELHEAETVILDEGVAELKFAGQAVAVLQGPARLQVKSAERIALHEGKLVMLVPPAAIGFTVELPDAEVVDLGTEFGVQVDDKRTSIVHVFDGTVELRRTGGAGAEEALGVRLQEGEAAAVLRGIVRPVRVDAQSFVRQQTLDEWQQAREKEATGGGA